MSGAMNRHCIPGLYVHSPDRGTTLRECPGIIKTMRTGFNVHVAVATRPGADTEETGHLHDLAWKDLCSVLNALSK